MTTFTRSQDLHFKIAVMANDRANVLRYVRVRIVVLSKWYFEKWYFEN